jgi:tRNA dimethylallyltransferase
MSRGPLLVIAGPTAAGKSAFAMRLSQRFPIEIVSADSVQIYRGLDIGSAKPSAMEQAEVVHHLIDIRDPHTRYSAAEFVADADRVIANIRDRGRLPVVVGGTGLYLRSLIQGLFEGPPSDPETRQRLEHDVATFGAAVVHARLAEIDPESARRLHTNDVRRVVRAIEVFELTGRTLAAHHEAHQLAEARYAARVFVVDRSREELDARIHARCAQMLRAGLVEETAALLAAGVAVDAPAFDTLGYRHALERLRGTLPATELLERFAIDTRRFARRQRTWFKGQMRCAWRDADAWERDLTELETAAAEQLEEARGSNA